ncbi:hypothetical protein RI367_003726 [Sorochytrium milnesiophthora]
MMQSSDATPASSYDRLAFICEYYDAQASLVREYQLFFYTDDTSVEMYDMKQRKTFLKKTYYPQLQVTDFGIGRTVNVFSRQLLIKDYADTFTRNKLSKATEQLVVVVPVDVANTALGHIISCLEGFALTKARMVQLTPDEIRELSAGKPATTNPSRTVVVLEASRAGGSASIQIIDEMIQHYGAYILRQANLASRLIAKAVRKSNCANSTVCIIKPHALASGKAGPILQDIVSNGFLIVNLDLLTFTRSDAEDFLEVYKGVLPEYHHLVNEFTTSACLAVELTRLGASPDVVVNAFRDVCGPYDPELAAVVTPTSVRAKYGNDRVRNAVHCTDLVEDAPLESQFLFQIVQN